MADETPPVNRLVDITVESGPIEFATQRNASGDGAPTSGRSFTNLSNS
jgi:hypothetical protein